SFTGALTRVAGEAVGTYAIQQGTLALSSNYQLTYVGANLTITARPITVTADAKTKVYGNTDAALTYQITSGTLVVGDSFTGALTRVAGEAVGTYSIQQGTLALSTNYALTYQITSGSLAFSDAFTGALTRAAGENVGTYSIQQGTLALSSNYVLTYVGANLTITKATLTVTADNKTRQYSDPNPTFTASYSGFKNGETLATSGVTGSPSLTTTATATSAPGPYTITA